MTPCSGAAVQLKHIAFMTPCSGAAVQLSGHIVCNNDAVVWSLYLAGHIIFMTPRRGVELMSSLAQSIYDAVVWSRILEPLSN